MKIINVLDKTVNKILIIMFIILGLFGLYALFDVKEIYDDNNINNLIEKMNENNFDILYMQNNINKDICAWIKIYDTQIDYPVVHPSSNSEYLDKDYKKDYSPLGSVFQDTNNDRYFNDQFNVIYAHNTSKLMFSDIKKFIDKEYFNSHKSGKLYSEKGVYNIDIYSVNIINKDTEYFYKLDILKNNHNNDILDKLKDSIINKRDINIDENDKIIMLSTCNKVGSKERIVLIGKMTKI